MMINWQRVKCCPGNGFLTIMDKISNPNWCPSKLPPPPRVTLIGVQCPLMDNFIIPISGKVVPYHLSAMEEVSGRNP